VKFRKACKEVISLEFLKKQPALKDMALFKYSRLSVQPVTEKEWDFIMRLIDAQK
jgi:predicted RNA-binding protein with PUA-like domain